VKNSPIARAALLEAGVAALILAGCHTAELALLDHPRRAPGVAMQDVTFHSAALNRDMPYRVFLPEKIAPGQRLPVVYLLHGGGANFTAWSNEFDVARYVVAENAGGLILVMPEGDSSYWLNAALIPRDKYEDYLTSDLIADVEARFPAAPGRESRAIVGISMGGFGAVKLALTHADLYAFAGALSPALDAPRRKFAIQRASQWWRFRSIFGPWGSKTRAAADPFLLVQSANPAATPYLYVTAGEQEPLLDPIRRFAGRLHELHFAYEFHTKPGGHDSAEWDAQLPGCFTSLMLHIRRPSGN
jgi:putative tributyrin esterase